MVKTEHLLLGGVGAVGLYLLLTRERVSAEKSAEISADYIVRPNDGYYEAVSAEGIIYGGSENAGGVSGTDASAVGNSAFAALTAGREHKEKVLFKGSFEVSGTSLNPDSKTIVDINQAIFKDINPQTREGKVLNIFKLTNKNHVDILGGVIDGDRGTVVQYANEYTEKGCGVLLDTCSDINVIGTKFLNCAGNGIGDHDGQYLKWIDLQAENCGGNANYELTNTKKSEFVRCKGLNAYSNDWNFCQNVEDLTWKSCDMINSAGPAFMSMIGSPYLGKRLRVEDCIIYPNGLFSAEFSNIDGLRVTDCYFRYPNVFFSNVTDYVFKNNFGFVTENSGTSTGTGAEQTIAHGLATGLTPNLVTVFPTVTGVTVSGVWADGTNIYCTVTVGKTFRWYAEF